MHTHVGHSSRQQQRQQAAAAEAARCSPHKVLTPQRIVRGRHHAAICAIEALHLGALPGPEGIHGQPVLPCMQGSVVQTQAG